MVAPLKTLLSPPRRGNLLDVLVFLVNLGLAPWLGSYLAYLAQTMDQDANSRRLLGMVFLAALVLPMAGAVLKRWHTHQRLGKAGANLLEGMGCLFSPIFYLVLVLLIVSGALAGLAPGADDNGGLFVGLVVLGMVVSIVHTAVVYLYFTPPKQAPRSALLRSGASDFVGDICLHLNMLLYQVMWNGLSNASMGPVKDLEDFAGRVFFLSFISLLIYFPPRMFYLVEDIRRPMTWLTLLLANLPIVARLFGYG